MSKLSEAVNFSNRPCHCLSTSPHPSPYARCLSPPTLLFTLTFHRRTATICKVKQSRLFILSTLSHTFLFIARVGEINSTGEFSGKKAGAAKYLDHYRRANSYARNFHCDLLAKLPLRINNTHTHTYTTRVHFSYHDETFFFIICAIFFFTKKVKEPSHVTLFVAKSEKQALFARV